MKRSFTFLILPFAFWLASAQKPGRNVTRLTGEQELSQWYVIYLPQDHKGSICTEPIKLVWLIKMLEKADTHCHNKNLVS